MPRVSVIIPAYNAASFIANALRSVEAQTYPDWEVVVADDGSTDETGAIATHFGERVRVVRSERNSGLASARNLAIEHARGELLALLDADDCWLPEYLESQIDAYEGARAQRVRVGLVTCDALLMRNGTIARTTHMQRLGARGDVTVDALLRFNPIFISCLIPTSALADVGSFASDLRRCEDLDLWLRIVESGYEVVRNPRALVIYRLGPDQLSAQRGYMARATEVVYRRALERGALTMRQRKLALRAIRRQQLVQEVESLRTGRRLSVSQAVAMLLRIVVVTVEQVSRAPRRMWVLLKTRFTPRRRRV